MAEDDKDRPPISPLPRSRVRPVADIGRDPPIEANVLVTRALERFEFHRREMQRWGEFLKMCRELEAEGQAQPAASGQQPDGEAAAARG